MQIKNSDITDIDTIFKLYDFATEMQKSKSAVPWPKFDRKLIELEILEKRQWKIVDGDQIACVWAITDDDPLIWEEKNNEPALYIHRISVNPNFRGQNFVKTIAEWSGNYAKKTNKKYVRMDTVGENHGLIKHYTKCGFDFLGLSTLKNTRGLPSHYHNATVSLFQLTV